MTKAVLLASTRADAIEIQKYIARRRDGRAVARSFVADLRRRCQHLAGLPGTVGHARPEFGSGACQVYSVTADPVAGFTVP